MKTNFRTLLLNCAIASLALVTVAQGQIDSTSGPSDTYIDNLVNSTTIRAAKKQAEASGVEPLAVLPSVARSFSLSATQENEVKADIVTPTKDQPFWKTKTLSISYGFNDKNSKLGDGGETVSNLAKTELYLESKTAFFLTASFTYQNNSKTDDFANLSDTNNYSFFIQPAQEVFHLFGVEKPSKGDLVAGLGLNYRRSAGDSSGPTGASSSDANAYAISPNLVYLRAIENTPLKVSVSPTYTMEWVDTTVRRMPTVNTDSGLFTLLGRVDDQLTSDCVMSWSATWKHDVNQRVAPGKTAVYRDWAEFGVAMRYKVNNSLQIKFGYSYEAFRSDYDTHKISATGVLTF